MILRQTGQTRAGCSPAIAMRGLEMSATPLAEGCASSHARYTSAAIQLPPHEVQLWAERPGASDSVGAKENPQDGQSTLFLSLSNCLGMSGSAAARGRV